MTTGKAIVTIWTFVSKVMSLLFNTLSRFAIAFLPGSKCLLLSFLQSPSAVILELKKINKVYHCFHCFPIYLPWSDGTRCHNLRFFNFFFLLYNIVLVLPYINMHPPWVYMCSPSWTPLPPPSPYHPSGPSQCTSSKHPVSFIEPGLVSHLTYDILHVSMQFSQIIPPSPSPTESKRLFYTSVSLLLSRIQGYLYHLSKFHIYALVYCIGVFLSGLLHSV